MAKKRLTRQQKILLERESGKLMSESARARREGDMFTATAFKRKALQVIRRAHPGI